MATAKAGPRKTSRTITLKLTEGEADLVLGTLGQVGGHPTRSPRKYAHRVIKALEGALGYRVADTDALHHSLGHVEMFNYADHPVIETTDRIMAILTSSGFQLHAEFDPQFAMAEIVLSDFMTGVAGVRLAGTSGVSS
jgi:hypothetical protein